jgi:serine/threonine protein kinase
VPAELIVCGEPVAVGVGGEFERQCTKELRDSLPDGYVLATNVHLPRGGSEFYECDVIVSAPGICDILELKCIRPDVFAGEDLISSQSGFAIDRVFSKLDHKAKVLATRRPKKPFPSGEQHRTVRIRSQVIVPSDTRISYTVPTQQFKPVITLAEAINKYRAIGSSNAAFRDARLRRENLNAWRAFRDESARGQRRTAQHLGRFVIRKELRRRDGIYEYFANDEPPCQMEVQLREFPYDPALPASELQKYLREVARESRVLMKLRHPYIGCVIGHFQTGASWVQVSDWFDGDPLEDLWDVINDVSTLDKLGILLKVLQALQFCHEKGVFHRNVSADTVWVRRDLSDVKLVGFDCALDLSGTSSANSMAVSKRNARLVPPENLQAGTTNPRLADVFQVGVLLYRILEAGRWPFESTLDYVTSGGCLRPFSQPTSDAETESLRGIALKMLDVHPERRPDLLSRIEHELRSAIAS